MADYPITAVDRRVVYSGSAGTGPYNFSFPVLAATDLDVYKDTTKLTLTTDYSVTISASDGTGSVTLGSAATGDNTVTIVGARAIQRTTDFVTAGDLLASSLNTELDSQTIFVQQASEDATRAIKAPVTDPTSIDMTLPAKDSRKGKYLAFNTTTGNPEAGASSDDVTTLAAVTTDIATLADIEDGTDATDAIQTVAGISSNVSTVAGISSNVTTVAGISSNVTSVAGNASNINTVAGNNSNVTTVAGISSDVTTVAADSTDIGTVAGISANVTTVAGISSDVTTVAGISGDVSSVAAQVVGYNFSTTTAMADPGSGNVRFNNATVASVTAIAIDNLDANGVDQSAYIALFDDSTNTVKGTLVFRTGGNDVATFNITGLTDNTGWFEIAVTHVASSGTFSNAEDTFIGFSRAGDVGTLSGADDGSAAAPSISFSADTNTGLFRPGADQIGFTTGGTSAMTISGSSVGIGTTAPSQKLTIQGTDARIYVTGANTDIDMTGTADGQLSLDGNGYGFGIALNSSGANLYTNTASRDLIFGTDETERMRIDGAGLVGLGTSSPLTNLVTVGTSMATSQAFVGSVADTSYSGGIINLSNSSRSIGITSDPTNAGAGSLINFSVDGTERMRIDSSGDVTLNAQADMRFADADSSNWVALQAPATVASNVTWTLPAADATASGQVLSSNAAGVLSWASAGGGLAVYAAGEVVGGTTTFSRAVWTDVTFTETADSGTTFDGTTFTVPAGEGGVYELIAWLEGDYNSIGNDGENAAIRFDKNSGTILAEANFLNLDQADRNQVINTSYMGSLAAGDTIVVEGKLSDGNGSGNAILRDAALTIKKVA